MNLALVDQGKNIKNVMDNYIDLMLGISLNGVVIDERGIQILIQAYLYYSYKLEQILLKLTQNSKTLLEDLANIEIQMANYFSDTLNLLLQ